MDAQCFLAWCGKIYDQVTYLFPMQSVVLDQGSPTPGDCLEPWPAISRHVRLCTQLHVYEWQALVHTHEAPFVQACGTQMEFHTRA